MLGTMVDEVTTGASETPESHSGAAPESRPTGESGDPESDDDVVAAHVDTEAHKRPPSAADSNARLAEDSMPLILAPFLANRGGWI